MFEIYATSSLSNVELQSGKPKRWEHGLAIGAAAGNRKNLDTWRPSGSEALRVCFEYSNPKALRPQI